MDTRKETFKGLTGLGGIEEQDEDEDSFPLPEMDMDGFHEEDFMDEAEHWDDLEASDSDNADLTSDEGPDYRTDDGPAAQQTDDDQIPQFDGGGDARDEDDVGNKQETDEDRWKSITIRRKRGRSTSSNTLAPIEQSPKAKRFRDLQPVGESSGQSSKPTAPPMLTRQRSRTAGISPAKTATSVARGSSIESIATLPIGISSPTILSTQGDTVQRLSTDFVQTFHGRYVFDCVEIPKVEPTATSLWSHPSSQSPSRKSQTPVKAARFAPKLYEEVEDDPIEDFDEGEEAEDDGFCDLPMDALIDDDPDIIILDTPPVSRSPLELFSPPHDLVSPPSPRNNYFLSTLEEVWSSPSPEMTKPDFFHSPPHPRSPYLRPTHSSSTKADSPSNTSSSRETFPSHSSSTPQTSPEKSRFSQRKRSSGAISDLSIINETVFPRKADLEELLEERDVKGKGSIELGGDRGHKVEQSLSLDKLSSGIVVDDSIVVDEIEDCTLPKGPSLSPRSSQQHSPLAPQHRPTLPQHAALSLQSAVPVPYNVYLAQALIGDHVEGPDIQAFQFSFAPPTAKSLMSSLPELGLPNRVHQKPYFSNEVDVPPKAKVFGGKEFRVQSKGLKSMPQFKGKFDLGKKLPPGAGYQVWEPNLRPPSYAEALEWLKEEEERVKASLRSSAEDSTQRKREKVSQIEGPTPKNPFGCKNTPTKVAGSIAIEKDFLDVLSLEVHCRTRGGLLPDPKVDPILAVFYCWQTEREDISSNGWVPG